jgi:hypothetical protein
VKQAEEGIAGANIMKRVFQILCGAGLGLALAACTYNGKTVANFGFTGEIFPVEPPVIRQPVLPEMLVNCRGHVFVPALGMTFVPHGKEPPQDGQFLREERLTPPYRVLPAGARVSNELSATRLNVELDKRNRVIGLYCG